MLAETPSLTDEEVLGILLVLLGMLAAVVVVFALGCFWAWRAGRGSQAGLVGFIVIGLLEGLVSLTALPGIFRGEPNVFVTAPVGALAIQAALYVVARDKERPGQ